MDSTDLETSTIEDSAVASAVAFTEVARSLFLADSVEDSLARAVELCVVTIEPCEFAGAFLLEGDVVTTRACTDPVVAEVDALQLRTGEGPCLDAIAHKLTFYADELGTDPRWPNFRGRGRCDGDAQPSRAPNGQRRCARCAQPLCPLSPGLRGH